MKKIGLIIALSSLYTLFPLMSKAQDELSRDEKKELKNEVKAYKKNLEAFKRFKEDKAEAEAEVVRLNDELNKEKQKSNQLQADLKAAQDAKASAESRLASCENQPKGFVIPDNGLYFAVQIGAFGQQNMPVEDRNNPYFRKDDSDGLYKYIMGVFNTVEEADRLRDFLMDLDFRSNPTYQPFVTPYRDGQRVPIEDALGPEKAAERRQLRGQ